MHFFTFQFHICSLTNPVEFISEVLTSPYNFLFQPQSVFYLDDCWALWQTYLHLIHYWSRVIFTKWRYGCNTPPFSPHCVRDHWKHSNIQQKELLWDESHCFCAVKFQCRERHCLKMCCRHYLGLVIVSYSLINNIKSVEFSELGTILGWGKGKWDLFSLTKNS